MGITVGELVSIPYLGTHLHAGSAGTGNSISWAHSCEVPNPWNWLDEGDLLMTNGYSIPADHAGQVAFVTQLAKAGISALAIGEKQHAPPITSEMIACADELALPVLFTAYEVPFIALARAVADANEREEQARLLQTVRLYDHLRESTLNGENGRGLLERLGEDLNSTLHLVDADTGGGVLLGGAQPPEAVTTATLEAIGAQEGALPALSRLEIEGQPALMVPVPSKRETLLVAQLRGSSRPGLAVLQHVATILALQVERQSADHEERRRLGAELLAHLMDGQIDPAAAQHQLEAFGLRDEALAIAACRDESGRAGTLLHHRLTERAVAHLLLRRPDVLLVAVPAAAGELLDELRGELGPDLRFGVSDPFSGPGRAPDAGREAFWALQAAESDDQPIVRYGENSPLFLPRTLAEAETAVRRVLGPLLDYDAAQGTELIASLRVFLACNRSWQRASAELFVHKQTLVYRMRRVEELTKRKLNDTAAVAELWLALRALELGQREAPVEAVGDLARDGQR